MVEDISSTDILRTSIDLSELLFAKTLKEKASNVSFVPINAFY